MTKKIFIFNGSHNDRGKSEQYIDLLIEKLYKIYEKDLEIYRYNGKNLNMKMCIGCSGCFRTLKCQLDKQDGFNKIKERMEESDFIIFSSPVFLHNVNAKMKNFIDRVAYWTHLFHLRGKRGMVIASASSNGMTEVIEYLKKIMQYFGVSVVCSAKLSVFNNFFDSNIDLYVDKICRSLSGLEKYDTKIEDYFSIIQSAIRHQNSDSKEFQYWKKNEMIKAKKLIEVL